MGRLFPILIVASFFAIYDRPAQAATLELVRILDGGVVVKTDANIIPAIRWIIRCARNWKCRNETGRKADETFRELATLVTELGVEALRELESLLERLRRGEVDPDFDPRMSDDVREYLVRHGW